MGQPERLFVAETLAYDVVVSWVSVAVIRRHLCFPLTLLGLSKAKNLLGSAEEVDSETLMHTTGMTRCPKDSMRSTEALEQQYFRI